MAAPPPLRQLAAASSPVTPTPPPSHPVQASPLPSVKLEAPSTPAVKPESPSPDTKDGTLPNLTSPSPETSTPSVSYTITIPSFSGWFSFDEIHETERKTLPEFFDGKSPSRNPSVYKYIRDSIIRRFRGNPSRKITFTEARRGIVGDVGSIRRVFDFLETWGLVNYTPSAKPLPKEKREVAESAGKKESPRKLCSSCKTACSIACFATDKSDVILCARCFVRGNYRPGLSSPDFKRVDINVSEETKTDWTDKETLHLLEAVFHYGEDWKKVAEHVGSRSEKDCVARFIKLPFGEQFIGPPEVSEDWLQYQKNDLDDTEIQKESTGEPCPSKRRRLTPLADASNPIMAQAAFLSAMVGSEVAKAAAQSAIGALQKDNLTNLSSPRSIEIESANDERHRALGDAVFEAECQLQKEQQNLEQSITDIVEVEMKGIQEKMEHFEELELQTEKERLQLRYMKDLFFADQLAFLRHRARAAAMPVDAGEKGKIKSSDVL